MGILHTSSLSSTDRQLAEMLSETLVFQHQSPNFYSRLEPTTYSDVGSSRENEEYMDDRIAQEDHYRTMLPWAEEDQSFLYATLVDSNRMELPSSYPGYTYLFALSPDEIELCAFEVVDANSPKPAQQGLKGLLSMLEHWESLRGSQESYFDPIVGGEIDSRIEVIIPFEVEYFDYVAQVEDRAMNTASRRINITIDCR